jgi:hypothetical protein
LTRLWIFSDLHYEMGNSDPPSAPSHDVCVCAGDFNRLGGQSSNWPAATSAMAPQSMYLATTTFTARNRWKAPSTWPPRRVKGTNVFLANPDEYVFNGRGF